MSYYKVLGSYHYTYSNESWYSNDSNICYYSYINTDWNFIDNYSFKIILKDKNNTLFVLTLKEILGEKFSFSSDNESIDGNLPSISYYTIEECTDKELSNITYEPLDKTSDIIFILEGADINNHLFSVNKYGNPDEYYYTGTYVIYMSKWLRVNN